MDANLISNVLLALFIFLTTVAGRLTAEARAQRKENRRLRRTVEKQDGYIFETRRLMRQHGITPPELPTGLWDDDDDDVSDGQNGRSERR